MNLQQGKLQVLHIHSTRLLETGKYFTPKITFM
jgi:hypothetical protein